MIVGLGAVVACGGDDDGDSFEGSYARASCERAFECYPDVRRRSRDDVEVCMGSLLGQRQMRLASYGEACAEATLAVWACESQAICNTEFEADGPCVSTSTRLRSVCPDAAP